MIPVLGLTAFASSTITLALTLRNISTFVPCLIRRLYLHSRPTHMLISADIRRIFVSHSGCEILLRGHTKARVSRSHATVLFVHTSVFTIVLKTNSLSRLLTGNTFLIPV
ncbi:hypothetical protein PMIN07_000998 [Paraphaeosphaeria minitans]